MAATIDSNRLMSYLDLVEQYPEHFYTPNRDVLKEAPFAALLITDQVRREPDNIFYTQAGGTYRELKRQVPLTASVPNLVTITWYWIQYMQNLDGRYHGETNSHLRSSTPFTKDGRPGHLALSLIRNRFLGVRYVPDDDTGWRFRLAYCP